MQSVFVMLCSFQNMEEGFARWLKWSNAKWRSAECVRNSNRAPCRFSRRGMRPQVAGKSSTLVWECRGVCWNYYSGRKLDIEDSSLVVWWKVGELEAYNDISKDYRALNFRVKQCQNFEIVYISIRALIFQNTWSWGKNYVRTCSNARSTFFWFNIQSFIYGVYIFNVQCMTVVESIYMQPDVQKSGEAMLSTVSASEEEQRH